MLPPEADAPQAPRTLADPRVQAALGRYRHDARRCALGGVAGIVLGTVLVDTAPGGNPQPLVAVVAECGFAFGFVFLCLGLGGLFHCSRVKRLLSRQPWVLRRASYRIAPGGANGQPALLVWRDDDHPEAVCSVSTTARRYRQLPRGPNEPLLIAGDPQRWAVAAPPDFRVLLVVKHPVIPRWSRRLRKIATAGAPGIR